MAIQQSKFDKLAEAREKEYRRFQQMCSYEIGAFVEGFKRVAGIDEAGRGPLAGPVVAACVILPEDIFIEGLNDSKKLTATKREILFEEIKEKAVAFGIGMADEKCIDKINILNATKLAMEAAIQAINPLPDLLLIDAVNLERLQMKQISIVKGDTLSISIAAASIIAKVTRDRLIEEMDYIYPVYGFGKHKGYGTEQHINAIKKYGICPIHRVSFTQKFVV